MAIKPQHKLANALELAGKAGRRGVVKSALLRRGDREILIRGGYLREIVKGWSFLTRPGVQTGESTAWYGVYWDFLAVYLSDRFGEDYCMSAVSSFDIHIGCNLIPAQVIVITAHGGKTLLNLPHNTSLLVYEDKENLSDEAELVNELRIMPLAVALCRMPPVYFISRPADVEIALRMVKDIGSLIRVILESRSGLLVKRFAGAYQFIGDHEKVRQIIDAAGAAGIHARAENPFHQVAPLLDASIREVSPYAGRIKAMFLSMRADVIRIFKAVKPKPVRDIAVCLNRVDDVYRNDAYNSLSIEGYRVSPEMIRKIRAGQWNPDFERDDRLEADAMAARGYQEAFRQVRESIRSILEGQDAVKIVERDYQNWYRALFSQSVKAGLLDAQSLAGHRNNPVFIRGSRHVPPPACAINDAVEALFEAMRQEENVAVRAVLGHFLFGFIHPYMDGNGRIARFLMNVMLVTGGYSWTIVRVTRRDDYLKALEESAVERNIVPFSKFILQEMQVNWVART